MDDISLPIAFWNKVSDDTLTIDILKKNEKIIVRLYTNGINVLNKKIELDDVKEVHDKLYQMLDKAKEVDDLYHAENYEEFKKKSNELVNFVKLMGSKKMNIRDMILSKKIVKMLESGKSEKEVIKILSNIE